MRTRERISARRKKAKTPPLLVLHLQIQPSPSWSYAKQQRQQLLLLYPLLTVCTCSRNKPTGLALCCVYSPNSIHRNSEQVFPSTDSAEPPVTVSVITLGSPNMGNSAAHALLTLCSRSSATSHHQPWSHSLTHWLASSAIRGGRFGDSVCHP